MSEELLPCRACGASCSIQYFGHTTAKASFALYVCSKNHHLGGDCPSTTAYISPEAWNARAPSPALAEKDAVIERVIQETYDEARKACREMVDGAQHADFVSDEYIKGFEAGFRAADMAILCRANAVFRQALADLNGAR